MVGLLKNLAPCAGVFFLLAFSGTAPAPASVDVLSANGLRPEVAIGADPAEQRHVVYAAGPRDVVRYCRLAPSTGCAVTRELAADGSDGDPPFVFTDGRNSNDVYVAQSRDVGHLQLWMWASHDGGQTFSAPFSAGAGGATVDAAMGPGPAAVPVVHAIGTDPNTDTGTWLYKAFPARPAPDDKSDGKELDREHLANASVAVNGDPAQPFALTVFDNNADTRGRVVSGSTLGSPFAVAEGGGAQLAAQPATPVDLMGPVHADGFVLLSDASERPAVIKLDRTRGRVGAADVLGEYSTAGSGSGDLQHAIAVGADRRLHAVWVARDVNGADYLLYAYSSKEGAPPYSTPLAIASGDDLRNIAIAMGKANGVVAWGKEFIGVKGANVRTVRIQSPDAAPATGSARAAQAGPRFGAGFLQVKDNAKLGRGGSFATVLARQGCVAAGVPYTARALVGNKRAGRFAARRVKVRRVRFVVGRRVAIDRKAPFAKRLSTRGLHKGRSYRVTVVLYSSKKRVRTLAHRMRVCA